MLIYALYIGTPVLDAGFPGGSVVENSPTMQEPQRCGFDPWVGKIPWKRAGKPTPVFLAAESHEQRNLAGYSP